MNVSGSTAAVGGYNNTPHLTIPRLGKNEYCWHGDAE
jgi:hypothetical protein